MHRREVARREALDLLDDDVGVVGVVLLEVRRSSSGPPFTRQVTFVHTDTTSLPDRLALEHRVEGRSAEHERRRQVEQLGDLLHRLGRDPAVLVLREVQRAGAPPSACAGSGR